METMKDILIEIKLSDQTDGHTCGKQIIRFLKKAWESGMSPNSKYHSNTKKFKISCGSLRNYNYSMMEV